MLPGLGSIPRRKNSLFLHPHRIGKMIRSAVGLLLRFDGKASRASDAIARYIQKITAKLSSCIIFGDHPGTSQRHISGCNTAKKNAKIYRLINFLS